MGLVSQMSNPINALTANNQLPKVLEIGTEETIMRNVDHRLL